MEDPDRIDFEPSRRRQVLDDDQRSENNATCCSPAHISSRACALLLMCILGFGSYFCYDNPAALQDYFKHDLQLTTTEFVYLYSWYSWPNVVLCFVGGFLIDRVFGIRLGTVIYSFLVVIGQLVFALGGVLDKFWLMVVGRFIFGIGGESLAVAQNNYAVLWFKGKELNMVFGLQLSFARVGSTVNFNVMEPLYNWVNHFYHGYTCLGVVLFIAAATTILSLVSALGLTVLDKRRERYLGGQNSTGTEEVVRIGDVRYFPVTFWMVAGICVSYYLAIFPFIALGKVFFMRKFEMPPQDANFVNSLVFIISAVASPLLGLLVDKVGRNAFWVLISIVSTLGCHALLAFTFLNPYIAMVCMGVSYSMLASALWPMVALIIPDHQLGTAYGIAQAVQNLGLALVTMLAGVIVDKGGYLLLEMFFLGWLCVALLISVLILIIDSNGDGLLNMSAKQRDAWEKQRDEQAELEREKLLASGAMDDVSPQDLLQRSDFHIRNRYLSRIGAALPAHCQKGQRYRALR
ncbi:major facilitator superfamily domain-containing protein 1-like [Neocloeon triangulifer]|uniref:major facilitator superfamily domain-containing protein 1-like n=1 Tax=Neocloeon triangulifer TaxID=2078957 RepID=UPI00286F2BD9|nr:major facilitator superfamily domain-containing protein 1-like [Neocloeon triangulifer]XP_059481990.1 major facilitator superfamily domain-containing protein 1-like [Neocloeon triangulifer]